MPGSGPPAPGDKGKSMKAMILAAGEGTRLRPLTLTEPKVLLPVSGVPLIEYTLRWLKHYGITEIAINLHHLAARVQSRLGDGASFGMRIVYSLEESLLGTAGGVKKMASFFDSPFAVIYGDVLTDLDLTAMYRFHQDREAMATVAIREMPNTWEVGVVEVDGEGRILGFTEKPPRGSEKSHLSSGGVYILEKQVLDYVPEEGFCDFAYDVFPRLIELGLPMYGYHLQNGDYLLDIGTAEKYKQANMDMKDRAEKWPS